MEPVLFSTPENPAPENRTEGYFDTHDGRRLRYAIFRCTDSVAKGTIVLMHGRNEFIEKYFEMIADLTKRGFWVATFDLRGQGGSARVLKDPKRGHIRRFSDYERDLDSFLERIVLPDTRLPFYLVAHSTGALIALYAAPRLANRIDRMVLSAPFVGLSGHGLSPTGIRRVASAVCLFGFGSFPISRPREWSFETNPLTSDEMRYRRHRAFEAIHPQLVLGAPTARWVRESMKAIERVNDPAHLFSISIPTIILAPTRDGIVPFADQERLGRYFRAAQIIPLPGAKHEIFNESELHRSAAFAALHAFIPGSEESAAEDIGEDSLA